MQIRTRRLRVPHEGSGPLATLRRDFPPLLAFVCGRASTAMTTLPSTPALRRFDRGADRDVSVIIPCLNEEGTIERCVRAALDVMAEHGIDGEVVVADNASTDNSAELARKAGARVVHE